MLSCVSPPDKWVSARSKADTSNVDAAIIGKPGGTSPKSPGAPHTGWAPTTQSAKRELALATDGDSARELVQPWTPGRSESGASPAVAADTEVWSPPSPPRNAWGRGLADASQVGDPEPHSVPKALARPAADLIEEDLVLSPIGMADSPRSAVNFDEPSLFSSTKIGTSDSSAELKSPTWPRPAQATIAPIYTGDAAAAPPPSAPRVISLGRLNAVR
jgi:hypothetical protein